MKRRIKYLIAGLLGFSTACSTVKQSPRDLRQADTETGSVRETDSTALPPRVVVMYGVRPPQPATPRVQNPDPASSPSVSAAPQDEETPSGE